MMLKFHSIRLFARNARSLIAGLVLGLYLAGCSHVLEPSARSAGQVASLPFETPIVDFAVHTDSTLTITYMPDSLVVAKYDSLHIFWATTGGTLSASGLDAQFIAPPAPDTALITATMTDTSGHIVGADTVSILVYSQLVILKADDFAHEGLGTLSAGWQKLILYVLNNKIHCGCGLIAKSVETGGRAFAGSIRSFAKSGIIEFWNHGYSHKLWNKHHTEFKNTGFAEQYEHILRGQALVKERTGIIMHTFGVPGNAFDENTLRALEQVEEIKVWLFSDPSASKMVLDRTTNIEHLTGNPSFNGFMNEYSASRDYLVLQIHPRFWDSSQFAEFYKIMEFLIQQNVTFVSPYEYYLLHQRAASNFLVQMH